MGLLCPVPRGSKPMMSKYVRNGRRKYEPALLAIDDPATPGPPGLTSREVTLSSWSSAGRRRTWMPIVSPAGSA